MLSFILDPGFVKTFETIEPAWGFGPLSEVTYQRSYSRRKEDFPAGYTPYEVKEGKETWHETVWRVVNGVYSIQKNHILHNRLDWDEEKAQQSAMEMYERMFYFKWLPPGRGLWSMGTPVIHEKNLPSALFNCAFVSTKDLLKECTKPFEFLMDMSMLGVGVGFDVKGEGKIHLHESQDTFTFTVPDTREGWVQSLKVQLEHYFLGHDKPVFDYSEIRPAGKIIKGFGGISSGPDPLITMHERIDKVLGGREGEALTSRDITDLMNIIGVCVVSGGIRRTAEIALGPIDDEDYITLKDYEKNPERMEWGWASNNTVYAEIGNDYSKVAESTALNGEPGYYMLENARKYGRMIDGVNNTDSRVEGINPCGEITLESYELCNIVETFPAHHSTLNDYKRTLKYAYLYAKTVTLLPHHWVETNRVQLRNRRLGVSQSGITQAIEKNGIAAYVEWCNEGYDMLKYYDHVYSEWLKIRESNKLTTVKPSGTVSILAGATAGIHYPESAYYIRRIRINKQQKEVIEPLVQAGYRVYDAPENPQYDVVVEFPINSGCSRGVSDVSMWEKFELVALVQTYWADNAVSATINFDPDTEAHQIKYALDLYQFRAKSISLLPTATHGYAAAPYEAITEEEYLQRLTEIRSTAKIEIEADAESEKFCDSSGCTL